MPDMSGNEVAAQIEADMTIKDTLIIFLTAAVSRGETDTRECLVGDRPCITKPVSMKELINCIKKFEKDKD